MIRRHAPCWSLLAVQVLGLFMLSSVARAQASFDCDKAERAVDRLICSTGPLADADLDLAARYKATLVAAPDESARSSRRDQQRSWLKQRDRECASSITTESIHDWADPAVKDAQSCLKKAYDRRIVALQDVATPPIVPLVMETLPLPPPKDAPDDPPWTQARLSPDASMLGLSDGNRVWLYRRDNRRQFMLTPPLPASDAPFDTQAVSSGEGMDWSADNILYAWVRLYNGSRQTFKATRDGAEGAVASSPKHWPGDNGALAESYPIPDPDNASNMQASDRYVVWMQSRGHGSFDLMSGVPDAEPQLLVRGGWELENARLDRVHSRVLYGTDTGIVVQALAGGTPRRIEGTRRGDVPMDFSGDTSWLVFLRNGTCDAAAATPGWRVCLARLPQP